MTLDPATPPPAVLPKRGVRGAEENLGDVPIYASERFALGMRFSSSVWGQRGSFYFLVPLGGFAGRRERRFPITEKGWRRMWQAFAADDPSGAAACKQELLGGSTATQPPTDAVAASAPAQEGHSAASQDPLERLERLAELHRQGALSTDEFEAVKRKLLDRL